MTNIVSVGHFLEGDCPIVFMFRITPGGKNEIRNQFYVKSHFLRYNVKCQDAMVK